MALDPLDKLEPEEMVQTENFYTYEDSNQVYDPRVQPFSYFYLTIAGQIEFGEFMNLDGLAIKYAFVSGDDWQVASGNLEGHGQFAFKSNNMHKKMAWNLPFEITFRSMTPAGWPQLVLYCIGHHANGDEHVEAYGASHVPITAGVHSKKIRMFSPLETGTVAEYFGVLREGEGLPSSISNAKAIANPEGREYSRVRASGRVTV